jgi:hypothetical protein
MDLLARIQRPVVQFDPANPEHRCLYNKFLQTRAWSHSPVRFALHEDFIELPHYLNMLLLQWYMSRDQQLIRKNREKVCQDSSSSHPSPSA